MYYLPDAGKDMCPLRTFSMTVESPEWESLSYGPVGIENRYPINYLAKQVLISSDIYFGVV